jgi:hypothetical protein
LHGFFLPALQGRKLSGTAASLSKTIEVDGRKRIIQQTASPGKVMGF